MAARAFKDAGRLAAELKGLAAEEETRRARVGELDREIAVNRVEVAAAEGVRADVESEQGGSGRGRRGVRALLASQLKHGDAELMGARRRRRRRGGGGGGAGGGSRRRGRAAEAVELLRAAEALRQRVAALVGEAGGDAGSEAEAEAGSVTETEDDDADDPRGNN